MLTSRNSHYRYKNRKVKDWIFINLFDSIITCVRPHAGKC